MAKIENIPVDQIDFADLQRVSTLFVFDSIAVAQILRAGPGVWSKRGWRREGLGVHPHTFRLRI